MKNRKPRIANPQDPTDKARLAAAKEIEARLDAAVDANGHVPEAETIPTPKARRTKPGSGVVGKAAEGAKPREGGKPRKGASGAAKPEAQAAAAADRENGRKGKQRAADADGMAPSEKAMVEGQGVGRPSKAPRRLGALDAAAQVLAASDKPMRAIEMVAAMAKQGLWKSPGGRTPEATLYAAILREIRKKGAQARFRKVERGLFASSGKGA